MEAMRTRVLIVEDHDVLVRVLIGYLKKLGFELIDNAKNWQEAISTYLIKDYDLVFMDIGLPGIHGFDLSYFLRRLEKAKKACAVIIAITGYPITFDFIEECQQNGINNAIQKPYKLEDIESALSQAQIAHIKTG
jgi:CheY-like chemotaxis protein